MSDVPNIPAPPREIAAFIPRHGDKQAVTNALHSSVTFCKPSSPFDAAKKAMLLTPRDAAVIPYMAESRRADLMLIPALLWRIFTMGSSDLTHADAHIFRSLLADAMVEPINGLGFAKATKITKRVNNNARAVLDDYFDGWENAKACAVIFFATQIMLEEGTLELVEGSAMADALMMAVGFCEHAVASPAAEKSARKQARKFVSYLTSKGHFA